MPGGMVSLPMQNHSFRTTNEQKVKFIKPSAVFIFKTVSAVSKR